MSHGPECSYGRDTSDGDFCTCRPFNDRDARWSDLTEDETREFLRELFYNNPVFHAAVTMLAKSLAFDEAGKPANAQPVVLDTRDTMGREMPIVYLVWSYVVGDLDTPYSLRAVALEEERAENFKELILGENQLYPQSKQKKVVIEPREVNHLYGAGMMEALREETDEECICGGTGTLPYHPLTGEEGPVPCGSCKSE